MSDSVADPHRVILVTGPAGAGRSTAINALEDIGFEAIDNLPISLVPRLLDGAPLNRPLALGIDARSRQFSADALLDLYARLAAHADVAPELLYLDAAPDVLLRRYSETRRRHPMAPQESPADGIGRERALLAAIRDRADVLVDTSDLTPHDLRARMQDLFAGDSAAGLAVTLVSFSYKRGLPHGADMVFDCRFLNNPYWSPDLRALTGLHPDVAAFVARDPRHAGLMQRVTALLAFLLPAFTEEGKAHLSIAFGCTGGQHRSVAVAESVSQALAEQGWQVSTRHRELDRRGNAPVPDQLVQTTGEQRP